MHKPVRGTMDWLPRVSPLAKRVWIESHFTSIATSFGYEPCDVPLLERKETFERSLGTTSDVVGKEMFHVGRRRGGGDEELGWRRDEWPEQRMRLRNQEERGSGRDEWPEERLRVGNREERGSGRDEWPEERLGLGNQEERELGRDGWPEERLRVGNQVGLGRNRDGQPEERLRTANHKERGLMPGMDETRRGVEDTKSAVSNLQAGIRPGMNGEKRDAEDARSAVNDLRAGIKPGKDAVGIKKAGEDRVLNAANGGKHHGSVRAGKETTLQFDKDDDDVVLRPETTAGVVRALLAANIPQNGHLPLHVFYCGPQFRYERPQRGRLRQFHQFGVECFGRGSFVADVECIALAANALKSIGLSDLTTLKMNSLGESPESRRHYEEALKTHVLTWSKETRLSADTEKRLSESRLLRILDSKHEQDQECVKSAPKLIDYLPEKDVERFNKVVTSLRTDYDVECEIDYRLVRGLDYYSHTCFEFVSRKDNLTVLAGGRYDGLARSMGYDKSPVPAVGWAAGIERLVLIAPDPPPELLKSAGEKKFLIVPLLNSISTPEEETRVRSACSRLAGRLRSSSGSNNAGATTQARIWGGLTLDQDKNVFRKAFKDAETWGSLYCCFIGPDEVEKNLVSVKNVKTGVVELLPVTELLSKCSSS